MIEMLIAVAIVSIFLSGIYATYIQVAKVNQQATAQLEALRNGRSALQSLSDELKSLNDIGGNGLLIGPDVPPRAFGDGIDNDGDGRTDEEIVNGIDDDPTSPPTPIIATDRHAFLNPANTLRERPRGIAVSDLGDANVDEDARFGQDFLIFQVTPETPSDIIVKVITYAIPPEGFDGVPNVLVRQTRIERVNPADPTGPSLVEGGLAPIAFGVLGFDLMYWDSNASAATQNWLTAWDSTTKAGERFRLPASIYMRLTVQADPRPAEILEDGDPQKVLIVSTVVNIESVIDSPLFERPLLP
jgi:type II secretory pathway pseudopilin PulG